MSTKKIGPLVFPAQEQHFLVYEKAIEDYQRPQRDYAMQFVRQFGVCIDVGAHVGIFSRHFAKHFDLVFAFEPIENLRDCLRQNTPENVSIYPCALSDGVGQQKMRRLSTTNSGCSFFVGHPRSYEPKCDDGEIIEVPCMTLDMFDPPGCDLIKIDVQGADNLVLRGAERTLRQFRPVVLMEEKPVGGKGGPTDHIRDAHDFLKSLGYTPMKKVGADRTFVHR